MTINDKSDLRKLMKIGRICGLTLQHMAAHLEAGMTTAQLDDIGRDFLKQHGARSAPILAYQFPGHTCISINDEAAHGIPGDRVIQPGDLVNIDVSAEKDGFWADTGSSFAVEPIAPESQRLLDCTKEALNIALSHARTGARINEIGRAVEEYAHQNGYEILQQLGGHGVGRHIHEAPHIPNHFDRRARQRLTEGLVVTLEPFLTTGTRHIQTMPDGWTLKTDNGSRVAQYEHTIVITRDEPIAVTAV